MKTLHTALLVAGLAAGPSFESSETFAAVPMMARGALATGGGASIENVVVVHRVVRRRPVVVHRRVVR
jgi:hypothetical protein